MFRLYRRFLDEAEAVPIADPGAAGPFFSPDGRWLAFTEPDHAAIIMDGIVLGTLKRVPVNGGPAEVIATGVTSVLGAHWDTDDRIILGAVNGLLQVKATGGEE